MTAAQKIAKEKFKKAIAIRKKTGVSLKEAFAEVYGKKKVGAVKKKAAKKVVKKAAPKKAAKKVVKKAAKKVVQKSAPRYTAKKHKNWATIPAHKRRVNGMENHKDTKSHNVNIRVVSGYNKMGNLDEINKGDILVSKWGYEQTNVDFYSVIKKTGLGVTLAPMRQIVISYKDMTGQVIPGGVNFTAKTINRKLKKYSGGVYVKINNFSTASKWNGEPQFFSSYA